MSYEQTDEKWSVVNSAYSKNFGNANLHATLAEDVALGEELVVDLESELGEQVDDVPAARHVDAVPDHGRSLRVSFTAKN